MTDAAVRIGWGTTHTFENINVCVDPGLYTSQRQPEFVLAHKLLRLHW